jgi:uncharacterized membrane-anchored protein YjiN (DUF445 family)
VNKSLATNLIAAGFVVLGFVSPLWAELFRSIGLFALSGALTNWLAVHMLFEKVPGLYGSGVIPERFGEFKSGIRELILNQFFQAETIDRLLGDQTEHPAIDLEPVIDTVDTDGLFAGLTEVVKSSSFGGMLSMVGGEAALEPLKEPFGRKARELLGAVTRTPEFQRAVHDKVLKGQLTDGLRHRVETLVDARLDELTPQMVKEIVQDMIRRHLGWLVVWGGFFGALVGVVAYWLP